MDAPTFSPPSIEVLNQLLPAYRFVDFIAQGGMGAVYRATQISLDREVAVKILPRELSADPEFRASFQTEARAMARLNHPNLISIFDSGDVDGMLYIAMEYVHGKSLYHSAWNIKVDPAEASRIIIAICEGLSHAHENGIIHRDIKPANILLTPKIEPKIGDFGLAQRVGVKHDGIVMGTPGYAAPELLAHPERADRRSDIFAVGVMLYELLTGQKPEPGVSASSLSHCPPEYDLIIQRATHPNPVMRYPDVLSLASALRDLSMRAGAAKAAPLLASQPLRPAAAMPAGRAVAGRAPVAPVGGNGALPPLVISSSKSSWTLLRNLLIIAGLLIVVVFVYQRLEIHKQDVAKQEEAYRIKQKEDEMRRRREAARAMAEQKNRVNSNPSQTPRVEPVKLVESPMESLERLKFSLSRGGREELPLGSKRRGEMDFFLVTRPMNWHEAFLFAEEHGAQLALPSREDDIAFLTSLLNDNETIWLGAGRSGKDQWLLLDGNKWSMAENPRGVGAFASLSHLGLVKAADASREFPFVIAWHRDGSMPCTLEALLQVTRRTLDTSDPLYPPGTMTSGTRQFLPVIRPLTRLQAYELAQAGGAHVAALSSRDEGYWLADHLSGVKAERGILLGGEKTGGVWGWKTKEPWTYGDWAPGSPTEDEDATLLVYLPKTGWHNADKNEKVDGVLLEWSKDIATSENNHESIAESLPDVGSLITKCRELLSASIKERDTKLAANIKSYTWDLDVWLRGLKPAEKVYWQNLVVVMKDLAVKGKIPSSDQIQEAFNLEDEDFAVPDAASKIHTYALSKEQEALVAYQQRNNKIRDAYVSRLKEMGATAQKSGQQDLARQLKNYLEESSDLEKWIASMLED